MIGTPEQDGFISRSMTGIVATVRRDGRPASSMVGIARHGDSLLFSTVASRVKGRTIARDPRCVVTIIHENEPGSFVSVEGRHLAPPFCSARAHWDAPIHQLGRGRGTEPSFFRAGRAVYEVTPTRKSGVLLDRPVLLED
ncbi:MAG: pyridoxamine 5'-phosphate oxidase family protein [Dehalococcoidia bacterium]|nr:pyridoxamine 5'-phosphate oxidase family protein [Dehalococcoidia bacterium]